MKLSKEIKAGLIAIFAIGGFVTMFQFMKGKRIFSTDNIFYAVFENVEGLEASNYVYINGLKVGQVDKITPNIAENGKVNFLVQIHIDNKYKFSKNSALEIYESGLISGTALRIKLDYGDPIAKDGDTLKASQEISMVKNLANQVEPLKKQMQSLLKNMDSVAVNTNKILNEKNRAEIAQLLVNLNNTVESFHQTSKQLNTVMAESNPKIQKTLDNANAMTISAKNALDKYGKIAENIDTQKLNETIKNLNKTTESINKILSNIENGEGNIGKLVKDEQLYKNLSETTQNLNKLIEDLKTNPKKYINISVFGKK